MPARLLYTNLTQAAGTVLTVSSAAAGAPPSWLKDEDRGLRWRSKLGWNIVEGINNNFVLRRGGSTYGPSLSTGNYATGALLATAIQAALEASDPTPVWSVTYNAGGTFKFVISSDLAFELLFGTWFPYSCMAKDLGFTQTDKGAATSHTAESASYKSREWIVVDLGSANPVTAGVVIEHNLGAVGTITMQGHTADTAAGWYAPDVADVLAGDGTIRLAYRASASKRYWRLLIDDVASNTSGYTQLGVWYVGTYVEPSVNFSVNFEQTPVPLSTIVQAISGATRRDERPSRWVYAMSWLEVPEADRVKLAAWVAAAPIGRPSLLALDPTGSPTSVVYGFFREGVPQQMSGNIYWTVPLTFEEQLP
jgi:hypothetical protein